MCRFVNNMSRSVRRRKSSWSTWRIRLKILLLMREIMLACNIKLEINCMMLNLLITNMLVSDSNPTSLMIQSPSSPKLRIYGHLFENSFDFDMYNFDFNKSGKKGLSKILYEQQMRQFIYLDSLHKEAQWK